MDQDRGVVERRHCSDHSGMQERMGGVEVGTASRIRIMTWVVGIGFAANAAAVSVGIGVMMSTSSALAVAQSQLITLTADVADLKNQMRQLHYTPRSDP